ncbi:TonB-dependent receptor [Pedobacter aquatilis]|uniref:TonB-dependent receptor n=1 Tax=Pedobacter aquatilis TaxID=351343 RepID=UPI002930D6A0|nr:TonB-dependent receptor [Pedobacter aquatilis]
MFKPKSFFAFLIFFSFLILGLSANAQTYSSINGRIIDENNEPVSTAQIILKGTPYRAESDENGNYAIQITAGKYVLIISRVGFSTQEKRIEVLPGKELSIQTTLSASGRNMKDVSIQGKTNAKTIKEQAFNVNVMETKQLYNSSADLNQALNKTSGVRVREDGGVGSNFSFSLNGFTGRQVKFFLDGIPMDNFGSSLALNNFPVNMAERVEIYKGVLPISLGADALGGAVNIVTRNNPNYLDVSYGYGSFNTHKASVNHAYTNSKTGFTVRTNAFFNYSDNNYKVSVQPIDFSTGQKLPKQKVERFHDSYESATAQIEAGVTNKKYADKLLIGLIASGNRKDIQTGVIMDQVFGARTSNSSSVIPTLKYKKNNLLIDGLNLNVYAAYNITRNNFIDTTRLRYNWLQQTVPASTAESRRTQLKNNDDEGLVTANLAYNLNDNHSVSFNYVMTGFKRQSSDVEDPNNVTFLYPQKLNKQVLGLAWQEKYNNFTATAFSKLYLLDAKSFESVSNGTGVATYRESTQNNSKLGYGAAGAYFITLALQAKASYEHTYRLPEATELLGDGLFTRRNSALKPEQSDNFNLGAIYTTSFKEKHNISVEANYIFRNAHDFIRLDQAQSQPIDRQYINIGDVQTNGVEGEIKYNFKNKFRAGVNMTYQNIIDKQGFISSTNFQGTVTSPNLGYGYKIPNMPFLFGNADLGYSFNNLGTEKNTLDISYSLNFVEEYYLTPSQLGLNNQDLIPRQFAHNLMANLILKGGKYNVGLECRNLADNALFDNYLLQKPGRSFFVKLRYFISK